MGEIIQTPSLPILNRVDFNSNEFDSLVQEKGRDCVIEKSLPCPCKSVSTNQLSSCKNCGGTGWIFINPRRTKLVIQSMSLSTDFKNWSEEDRGTISISAMHREELTFMDRITISDGESVTQEVLHFKTYNENGEDLLFSYSSYIPKEILYISLFISPTEPLKRLELEMDYTISGNKIYLDSKYYELQQYSTNRSYEKDLPSVTIRYKHNPVYHIIEMRRETMQSYRYDKGKENLIHLPTSCIGRRAHYILGSGLYTTSDIINNSYIPDPCKTVTINGFQVKIPCISDLSCSNNLGSVIWDSTEGNFKFRNKLGYYQVVDLSLLMNLGLISTQEVEEDWNYDPGI